MRWLGLVALGACASQSFALSLFDSSAGLSPTASQWGWTYQKSPNGNGNVSNPSGGSALGMTSDNTLQHGFGRLSPVALDRNAGYSVTFDLQTILEFHSGTDRNNDGTDDRAGLSVSVIGSDLKGVELGFWQDRIFAQQANFTQNLNEAAFVATDSFGQGVAQLPSYKLDVKGNNYTLSQNNVQILTGTLKDYSASGLPAYTTANSLFIGDNSTSAAATARWSSFGVSTVPEPSSMAVLGLLVVGTLKRRKA